MALFIEAIMAITVISTDLTPTVDPTAWSYLLILPVDPEESTRLEIVYGLYTTLRDYSQAWYAPSHWS